MTYLQDQDVFPQKVCLEGDEQRSHFFSVPSFVCAHFIEQ